MTVGVRDGTGDDEGLEDGVGVADGAWVVVGVGVAVRVNAGDGVGVNVIVGGCVMDRVGDAVAVAEGDPDGNLGVALGTGEPKSAATTPIRSGCAIGALLRSPSASWITDRLSTANGEFRASDW